MKVHLDILKLLVHLNHVFDCFQVKWKEKQNNILLTKESQNLQNFFISICKEEIWSGSFTLMSENEVFIHDLDLFFLFFFHKLSYS